MELHNVIRQEYLITNMIFASIMHRTSVCTVMC